MASSLRSLQPDPASYDFLEIADRHGLAPLQRGRVTTLQVNVGWRCDLACHHCHVEAGPTRTEMMDHRTADRVLEILQNSPLVSTLDLTGGAPELNAQFRHLVRGARKLQLQVIDRCNLTVLLEPGQEDTAAFLAENGVKVIASLPCYTDENVNQQRGRGVFEKSIKALRQLAGLGYGQPGSELGLDLVYNPIGATLPPPQEQLEKQYRIELRDQFGIEFHRLLTITNMPIRRFAHSLEREGLSEAYQSLLLDHFNPATFANLMCRETLSVSHDGRLFDCDFNQMTGLPIKADTPTVWDVSDLGEFESQSIATASHCFGCTAGAGSSCGGSLTR
jgi:radical SAM/Cys-rich protein